MRIFLTLLVALFASAPIIAQAPVPKRPAPTPLPTARPEAVGMSSTMLAGVMPEIRRGLKATKIPGAIVLVMRRGKVVLFESAGHADLEGKKPLARDAVLRFYSMTKPITSVAAMMLVERRKLDLDRPVAHYLPEMEKLRVWDIEKGEPVPSKKQPTVRDLMRHTAGFTYGFFGNTPVDRLYRAGKVFDPADDTGAFVEKIGRLPMLHEPGTTFHYGVATDVLGALIERVSKQRLGDFFRDNIFVPLGMRDTGFRVRDDQMDRFVPNFGPIPGGGVIVIDGVEKSDFRKQKSFDSGGGGLISTAHDYALFCRMLLEEGKAGKKRLLKKKTVAAMLRNQLPGEAMPSDWLGGTYGVGFGLGFAIILASPQEPRTVSEASWSGAASTHFFINPRQDLAVLVLSQFLPSKDALKKAVRPMIYEAIKR